MNSVIFDLDNTLTDRNATIRLYADVFVDAFHERLLPGTTAEYLAQLFIESDGGGYVGHEKRCELLAAKGIWRGPVEPEILSKNWKVWIPNNPEPMDGLYELLNWLREGGVKLGMVTNGSSSAQRRKIGKLGIADRFDAIIVSEEAGVKKPDGRIFDLVVRRLGVSARDCVFVGDDPVNDYQGALQAGMTPVWFEGFRPWILKEEPRIQISSLRELSEILEDLLDLAEEPAR